MDAAVQNSVVAVLSQRPEVVHVGPFVIGWDPTTDSKYISYATPIPHAMIRHDDVSALVDAFREIGRTPRLEYVVSAAPELEDTLLSAGFTVEARHDYLICTRDTLQMPAGLDGIQIREPESDEDYRGLIAAQNEAFGAGYVATDADVARARRTREKGGVLIAAVAADGLVLGGGQASPPSAGLAEVAGIAVREQFRRRGIAGAVTAAVTERVLAAGAHAGWLEASGEQSWRVYERVGYVPAGKRLYIALD